MGIYYYAIDYEEKKYFSAPRSYAIKSPGIFAPNNPFPSMVIMKNTQGYNFEIVDDCSNDVPPDNYYKDITEEVFKELKKYFNEWDSDEEE